MFAGDAGAFYEVGGGNVAVEAVTVWATRRRVGASSRRPNAGAPAGARSRDRRFRVELRCPHVEEAIPEGALCAPLAAEGESLGVLHLQLRQIVPAPRKAALFADRERLVGTVAEQLELTLANFRLRETLASILPRSADGLV